jgi:hypothetical protein
MEFQQSSPLISCICITDSRIEMLLKSIISFEQQTYPNKELVISYPYTDQQTKQLVQYLLENTTLPIISVERNKADSIGMARNNAVSRANGEYICMWDDDDLYANTRLTMHFESLVIDHHQFQASVLCQILLYHRFDQRAYLSFPSYWACTLFCKKAILQEHPCEDTDQFEYSTVIRFLNSNQLLCSIGDPTLYVAVFHGKNLIKYSTFLYLVNQSETISKEISEEIKNHTDLKIKLPFELI